MPLITNSYKELARFAEVTDRLIRADTKSYPNSRPANEPAHKSEYEECSMWMFKEDPSSGVISEFVWQQGDKSLPPHCHPETHVRLHLLLGEIVLDVEGYVRSLKPGESALVPAGFRHAVHAVIDSLYVSLHCNEKLTVECDHAFPPWPTPDGLAAEPADFAEQLITAFLSLRTEDKSWFYLVHVDPTRKTPKNRFGASPRIKSLNGWRLDENDQKDIQACWAKSSEQPFLLSTFLAAAAEDAIGSVPTRFIATKRSASRIDSYDFRASYDVTSSTWNPRMPPQLETFMKEKGYEKSFRDYLDYVFEPHLAGSQTFFFCTPPLHPGGKIKSLTNLAVGSHIKDAHFFSALESFYLKVLAMLQQHEFSDVARHLEQRYIRELLQGDLRMGQYFFVTALLPRVSHWKDAEVANLDILHGDEEQEHIADQKQAIDAFCRNVASLRDAADLVRRSSKGLTIGQRHGVHAFCHCVLPAKVNSYPSHSELLEAASSARDAASFEPALLRESMLWVESAINDCNRFATMEAILPLVKAKLVTAHSLAQELLTRPQMAIGRLCGAHYGRADLAAELFDKKGNTKRPPPFVIADLYLAAAALRANLESAQLLHSSKKPYKLDYAENFTSAAVTWLERHIKSDKWSFDSMRTSLFESATRGMRNATSGDGNAARIGIARGLPKVLLFGIENGARSVEVLFGSVWHELFPGSEKRNENMGEWNYGWRFNFNIAP